jgi:hypothetical protein
MSKRTVIAAVAAVAAFGAVSASAASLGGLTSGSLGADTKVVASCDTNGIGVDYVTTYNTGAKEYLVSSVTLTGVDPLCLGQKVNITLGDSAGVSLGTVGVTPAVTATAAVSQTFSVTGTAPARTVVNVAVVLAS